MIDLYDKGKARFDWWQDWRDECVAIVAAGPSAKTAGVEKLKDRIHVIAINESFQLTQSDILYSCDAAWWMTRISAVNKKFSGIKLGFEPRTEGVKPVTILKKDGSFCNELQFDEPAVIGSGGNSGFQMINLSAQMGATAIALIGFDMQMLQGVHWHGLHNVPMRNPDGKQLALWAKQLDAVSDVLKNKGIDVVNCSATSALNNYPKMTVDEALNRWSL